MQSSQGALGWKVVFLPALRGPIECTGSSSERECHVPRKTANSLRDLSGFCKPQNRIVTLSGAVALCHAGCSGKIGLGPGTLPQPMEWRPRIPSALTLEHPLPAPFFNHFSASTLKAAAILLDVTAMARDWMWLRQVIISPPRWCQGSIS